MRAAKQPFSLGMIIAWFLAAPALAAEGIPHELAWIPAEASLIVVFEPPAEKRALHSQIGAEILFACGARDEVRNFANLTRQNLAESLPRLILAGTSTVGRGGGWIGIIEPIPNVKRIEEILREQGIRPHSYQDHKLFIAASNSDRKADLAIALLDDRRVAFGNESLVKQSIDLRRGQPDLARSDSRHAVISSSLQHQLQSGAVVWGVARPDWFGYRFSESLLLSCDVRGRSLSRALQGIEASSFSVQGGTPPTFQMTTHARDPQDAFLLADALRGLLASVRLAGKQATPEVRQVVQNARVETKASVVRLTLNLPVAAMERIKENETSARILRWNLDSGSRERRENIRETIDMLDLQDGSRVADIGASLGFFSVRLCQALGSRGKVYSEDIDGDALAELRRRAFEAPWPQIEVIQGSEDDPRLPADELDAALIKNSYHEMTRHQEMLAGIFRALKPGGRLLLVEPTDPKMSQSTRAEQEKEHVLAPELAEQDLRQSGFEIVARNDQFIEGKDGNRTQWLILARKPPGIRK